MEEEMNARGVTSPVTPELEVSASIDPTFESVAPPASTRQGHQGPARAAETSRGECNGPPPPTYYLECRCCLRQNDAPRDTPQPALGGDR